MQTYPKLQPLRITNSWQVNWNMFLEQDPSEENIMFEFSSSTLLSISSDRQNRCIELVWLPMGDLNGRYVLEVFNLTEKYNDKKKIVEKIVENHKPCLTFESKSRIEIVDKIEEWVSTLEAYKDPRIFKSKGVIDEFSEALRIEILDKPLTDSVVEKIITKGSSKIQSILLSHPDVSIDTIKKLAVDGGNKGVRNKANEKLKNSKYRNLLL